ncbi:membrane bound O-acyl transferase family-domain-containing protein [Penicillium malachiteum]|nr:membrane bound O-acyl transferase family-domain-containing protein [Penicillium malachiteum]
MIIASQLPAWLLPVTQWMLIQVIVGLVATFTPSRSRIRDAALVTAVALAYSVQCVVDKAFPSAKVAGLVAALCWANIFNAVDILLLSHVTYVEQLDWERGRPEERLKQSSAISSSEVGFSWRKLAWALELPFNLRRVGTPWQINKLPIFQSGNDLYTPSRLKFLRDRGLMLCLALLAMGFLHRRENDQELLGMISLEKESFLNQVMQISARAVLSQASLVVSYWINMRAGHQLIYSFCSFISVALGIYEPASWPPLGGSILEAWSLRQFWG